MTSTGPAWPAGASPVDEAHELDRVDIGGWARVDPGMLDLLDEQSAAGVRLALLSNAPLIQAEAFDELAGPTASSTSSSAAGSAW